MSNFVLMLTRDDVTVPDAAERLEEALRTDVRHIGFKDVGVPVAVMKELVKAIQDAGRKAHLEVVSLSEADERRSIDVGLDLGFDYILGGTRWRQSASMIASHGVSYFPYAGTVLGHPGTLAGSVKEILADIDEMAGVATGVNLLAYRHVSADADALVDAICSLSPIPVLVAGAISSLERIRHVTSAGAWGFTIGAAALDLRIAPGSDFESQIAASLHAATAEVTR